MNQRLPSSGYGTRGDCDTVYLFHNFSTQYTYFNNFSQFWNTLKIRSILWNEAHWGEVPRWWRNRMGRPLSPPQIHQKIIWMLSNFHKTYEHWWRTPGCQKSSQISSKGGIILPAWLLSPLLMFPFLLLVTSISFLPFSSLHNSVNLSEYWDVEST